MKKITRLACAALFGMFSFAASGHEYKSANIVIDHPRGRMIIPSRPSSIYMHVHNTGDVPDKIISTTSTVAERVEIHSHTMTDGIMKMRRVDAVDVPAKSQVEFKPGGLHLMVFGLKPHVKAGSEIPLTVVFEKAGAIAMKIKIESLKTEKMKLKHGTHSGQATTN